MKYKLAIFITFLLIKILFQIDITNYELYLYARNIDTVVNNCISISDYFYKCEVTPGKIQYYDSCRYCTLKIGGYAKYNNCSITSNNTLYFNRIVAHYINYYELFFNNKKYLVVEGKY